MTRKLLPGVLAVGLLAAACGGPDVVVRTEEAGEPRFFPQVLDADATVGAGLSLAADADGNPHLAYLAFEEEPEPGEPPPAPDPEAPEFPAVKHAHIEENALTRSVVAEGRSGVGEGEETAIAVDQEGVHHVVWTEGGDLLYANNADGEFSDPQTVASGDVAGPSVAAGDDGSVWAAFHQGGTVMASTPGAEGWSTEEIGPAAPEEPATTVVAVPAGEPLIAYGDGGTAAVARRDGGDWSTEAADQQGGIGVAMAMDADGNPHLAYFDSAGTVKHAHSIDEGPWEVSEVAQAGGVPAGGGAAIAVDDDGVHHVAWQADTGIGYANNQDGDFGEEELAGADNGAFPALAVGPEGDVVLAWHDPEESEVQLAVRSERPPLLAFPPTAPPAADAGPGDDAEPSPAECAPDGTELAIEAPPGSSATGFDKTCLAAPAGEAFTVEFDNTDTTVHNWALYTDESAEEHLGGGTIQEPVPGGESETYEVDAIADPGQYFYRCDFHPTTMTGTFVVE